MGVDGGARLGRGDVQASWFRRGIPADIAGVGIAHRVIVRVKSASGLRLCWWPSSSTGLPYDVQPNLRYCDYCRGEQRQENSLFEFDQRRKRTVSRRGMMRAPTHSSRQPVRCAAHHTPAPVQITLRRALRTATIARLSLISRAASSEPAAADRDDCGNFLSGDVRVPASKATMLYASGSSGGSSDLSAFVPPSVRTHLDREERSAYEMVGVVDELDVSDRSGASSADSGAGITCTRCRNLSTRWGSSETLRLSDWGGPLNGIERGYK
jgi:hypothetical protein